jgi:helicase MOV-10
MASAGASGDCQICEACNIVVRPASAFAAHVASTEHQERVRGNFVRCPVCTTCFLRGNWSGHVRGAPHRAEAQRQGLRANIAPEVPSVVQGHRRCALCNLFIQDAQWDTHRKGTGHLARAQARQQIETMKAAVRQAARDQGGVTVSHPDGVEFGVLDVSRVGQGARTHVLIKTTPDEGQIRLLRAKVATGVGASFASS